jgi:hypothetical protein
LVAALATAIPATVSAQAPQGAPAANKTYDAVVDGMSCKQQQNGRMDCEYKVGKSLRFVVNGVGQQDVVVNFFKVDADEDYYASVAPLHGCVVVRPVVAKSDTATNLAFVSPQDGKIYRNWNTCLKPAKKAP